jgi:hypothetical protein
LGLFDHFVGSAQRVGWVERSDTHQLLFVALMGFAKGSTKNADQTMTELAIFSS